MNTWKTHPAIRYETIVYARSREGLTAVFRLNSAAPGYFNPERVDANKLVTLCHPNAPGTGWRLMTEEEVQAFLNDPCAPVKFREADLVVHQ